MRDPVNHWLVGVGVRWITVRGVRRFGVGCDRTAVPASRLAPCAALRERLGRPQPHITSPGTVGHRPVGQDRGATAILENSIASASNLYGK